MHELSVTENILNISIEHARQAQAARVTDIYLSIGRLSSLVDDSVQFYWDMISEGTLCAGAKLHFQRLPAVMACQDCAHEYELPGELTLCPSCGSARVRVISGEQFSLDSIEVIKEDPKGEPV